jgi:protein TIF31
MNVSVAVSGDILYLVVYTLENRKYHLTCCTKGFYVNESTSDEFNPKPANNKFIYHSLVDLLGHLSPGFKRNLSNILKQRAQKHIFERLPTPYQVGRMVCTFFNIIFATTGAFVAGNICRT